MPSSSANSPDRGLDAALRAALRPGPDPVPGCDVELAVAYAEGRVKGAERGNVETHLAQCAACRALATTLLEELLPETPAPAPVRPWWSLRWAIPALAGVAIVVSMVWNQREQVLQRPTSVVAVRPAAAPVPPDISGGASQVGAATPTRRKAGAAGSRNEPIPEAGRRGRENEKEEDAAPATQPARRDDALVARGPQERAVAQSEERHVEGKLELRAAADKEPAGKLADEVAAASADFAKQKPAELADRDAKQQAGNTVTGGPLGLTTSPNSARLAYKAGSYRLPAGAPLRHFAQRGGRLWAVSDGGRIFRSLDGGQTWQPLPSPTTEDLVKVEWESEDSLRLEDKRGNQYRIKP